MSSKSGVEEQAAWWMVLGEAEAKAKHEQKPKPNEWRTGGRKRASGLSDAHDCRQAEAGRSRQLALGRPGWQDQSTSTPRETTTLFLGQMKLPVAAHVDLSWTGRVQS